MAKKKDFLADFSFTKFENLKNGVEIPVSNSLKTAIKLAPDNNDLNVKQSGKQKKETQAKVAQVKSELKNKTKVEIPSLDYTNKSVKAMVNVIPTSTIPNQKNLRNIDIDLLELGALTTKEEKVLYLAMRGWSLKVEQRRNSFYHYATKYIKRKKYRIYLGPLMTGN